MKTAVMVWFALFPVFQTGCSVAENTQQTKETAAMESSTNTENLKKATFGPVRQAPGHRHRADDRVLSGRGIPSGLLPEKPAAV
jgi:hypothetical protein